MSSFTQHLSILEEIFMDRYNSDHSDGTTIKSNETVQDAVEERSEWIDDENENENEGKEVDEEEKGKEEEKDEDKKGAVRFSVMEKYEPNGIDHWVAHYKQLAKTDDFIWMYRRSDLIPHMYYVLDYKEFEGELWICMQPLVRIFPVVAIQMYEDEKLQLNLDEGQRKSFEKWYKEVYHKSN